MPQALRLALKFSSTTTPSPVALFQASQVSAGYHAYLAFDTYLITEPRFSNRTVASRFLDNPDFRNLIVHINKNTSDNGTENSRSTLPFRLKTMIYPITSNVSTSSTAHPFRLLERRHVASGKILSSWLLRVSSTLLSEVQNQLPVVFKKRSCPCCKSIDCHSQISVHIVTQKS